MVTYGASNCNYMVVSTSPLILQSLFSLLYIELEGSISTEPILSNTGTLEGCVLYDGSGWRQREVSYHLGRLRER